MSSASRNTVGRYAANAASAVLATLISMTVLIWVNQYLLNRIDPEEYQLVPLLTSLLLVFDLFRQVFAGGLSRFMVEADALDDPGEVTRIVSSMFPVLALVALVLCLLGAFVVLRIEDMVAIDPMYLSDARLMFAMLIFTLAQNIATTPFRIGLIVRMRLVEENAITLGTEILRAAILLYLLFGVSTRALWLVTAATGATLAQTAVLIYCTRAVLPSARLRLSEFRRATAWRLLSFSLWTLVLGVALLAQRALPAVLLNRFSGAVDVAAFHVGYLADIQVRRLTAALAAPSSTALTALQATEGEAALQPHYYRGGRYHLWVTLALMVPLIAFAASFVRLYVGDAYADAAQVIVAVGLSYPFVWASAMFYRIAFATGRIRSFNLSTVALVGAIAASLYLFVVVLEMGAAGAGYGIALANVVVHAAVIWPLGLRMAGGTWRAFLRQTLLPGCAPFVGALAAGLGFAELLPVTDWGRFVLGTGAVFAVYLAILFGACLDTTDRHLIGRAGAKLGRFLVRRR